MHVSGKVDLLPVTALEFCSVGGGREVLAAGEGPYLKVLSLDGSLLLREECLPFGQVHGIRPGLCGKDSPLLIFGQKALMVVELELKDNDSRVVRKSEVFELSDWILDVAWLQYLDPAHFEVAAATAHNSVVLFSSRDRKEVAYHSEVNCILYSARLSGHSSDTLAIASGTVFNQILLWHLEGEGLGSQGVIFSIRFSADGCQVVSVSDDRTIRLWNLPTDWRTMHREERKEACSLVLFGHTARVWDARLLPEYIVSIGEDATCRVWDYHGQCLQAVGGHRGKSIWSLAVDMSNSTVATGGGDCSIRTFSLKSATRCDQTTEVELNVRVPQCPGAGKEDLPRSVVLNGGRVYCLTNNGFVYTMEVHAAPVGSGRRQLWKELHHDAQFSGYSIMACHHSQRLLAVGSLNGCIKILRMTDIVHGVKCGKEATKTLPLGGHSTKIAVAELTTLSLSEPSREFVLSLSRAVVSSLGKPPLGWLRFFTVFPSLFTNARITTLQETHKHTYWLVEYIL